MGVCVPRPSALILALGSHLFGPWPPRYISRLNTILLSNFEVVITLKFKLSILIYFCFNYKWCKKQKDIK